MSEVIDRQTMHALSADTRQGIVKLLSKRPYTASELSRLLGKHVTTITEHLSVLEKSGVVKKRDSTNKWVYYTLTDKGERFFRPNFTWVVMFSIASIAIVGGLHQIFFISYTADMYSIGEEAAPMIAQKTAEDLTATTTVSDTNMYIGIAVLLVGIIVLWKAWDIRRKHSFAKAEMIRTLSEK